MELNHYSQLLIYIKSLADADAFINTVTQGAFDKLDLDKSNIFPILHITITGGSFTNGQTIKLNVEIVALQQRDINNEERTDKFMAQDNEVDNLNEMLAVLNRLWTSMFRDFEENDIVASENPTLDIIEPETTTNLIEGWLLSFEVEMPNTSLSLC